MREKEIQMQIEKKIDKKPKKIEAEEKTYYGIPPDYQQKEGQRVFLDEVEKLPEIYKSRWSEVKY